MPTYKGFHIDKTVKGFDVYLSREHWVDAKRPILSCGSLEEAERCIDDMMSGVPIVQVMSPWTDKWEDFTSIKDESDLYYGILMCDGKHPEFKGRFRIIAHVSKILRRVAIYPEDEREPI